MPNRRRRSSRNNDESWIIVFILLLILIFCKDSKKQPLEEASSKPTVIWLTEENREFLKPTVSSVELTIVCYLELLYETEIDHFSTPRKFNIHFDSENFELYEGADEDEVLANFHSNDLLESRDFYSKPNGDTLEIPVKGKSCLGINTQTGYRVSLSYADNLPSSAEFSYISHYSLLLLLLLFLLF